MVTRNIEGGSYRKLMGPSSRSCGQSGLGCVGLQQLCSKREGTSLLQSRLPLFVDWGVRSQVAHGPVNLGNEARARANQNGHRKKMLSLTARGAYVGLGWSLI